MLACGLWLKFLAYAVDGRKISERAQRGKGGKDHRQFTATEQLQGAVGAEPDAVSDFVGRRKRSLSLGQHREKKMSVETHGNLRRGLPMRKMVQVGEVAKEIFQLQEFGKG